MPRSVSVGSMIRQLEGMLGTSGLNPWERGFVENMVSVTDHGNKTSHLYENQVLKVEEVWSKHFA